MNHTTCETTKTPERFDRYTYGTGPWMLLANELLGSPYRYAALDFPVPMGPEACPDHLTDPPDPMRGGWTTHHEIDLALHRDRGTVMLRACFPPPDSAGDPKRAFGARIAAKWDELEELREKLVARLEVEGGLDGPVPLTCAVVVPAATEADFMLPDGVPREAVVTRRELPALEARLNEVLKARVSHEARRVAGPLVDVLDRRNGPVGQASGHEKQLASYLDITGGAGGVVELGPEAICTDSVPASLVPDAVVAGLPQTRHFDVEAFREELQARSDSGRASGGQPLPERGCRRR